jgi:protein O-GlcNAc transferase
MQRRLSEQAIQVRASAVAALTANVLAAKDMANAANETLTSMGVDVSTITAPTSGPSPSTSASRYEPTVAAQQVLKSTFGSAATDEAKRSPVMQLVEQVARDNGCTTDARNMLLNYAHTQYSANAEVDLLPLLHMLDRVHPFHCPTLLLLSCVYYTKGIKAPPGSVEHIHNLEASIVMNQRILEIDPEYVRLPW